MPQVFLSHSTDDAEFVNRLAADLREAGLDVWKAPDSIRPGEEWVNAIQRGLNTSSHLVLVMSPAAVDSDWVEFEMNTAIRLERARKMVIVPVAYQPCDAPLFWGNFQAVDVQRDYAAGLDKLFDRLRVEKPADPPPSIVEPLSGVVGHGTGVALDDMLEAPPEPPPLPFVEPEPVPPPVEPEPEPRQATISRTAKKPPPTRTGVKVRPLQIGIAVLLLAGIVVGTLAIVNSGGRDAGKGVEQTPAEQAEVVLPATNTPTEPPVATDMPSEPPTEIATPTETLIPLGYAGNPVETNAEWTPVIETFDGVQMALVPAGCFMMGSEDGESDEAPVEEQCFAAPFWIDIYEVTNEQYGSEGHFSGANRPRESVSWFEAVAHCESRGARLPTEAEWEYAARGPDGLKYPWGNDFVADNVVYYDNSNSETANVGSRPGGVSWAGAHDLSGNVWEWFSTLYAAYPYDNSDGREVDGNSDSSNSRVLRGGSWNSYTNNLRAANRYRFSPSYTSIGLGFRCARSQ